MRMKSLKFKKFINSVNQGSFQIINAAAGSGKTFSLVYRYLKKLLSAETDDVFRSMLALTFTNKAVNEMKGRILNFLFFLSSDPNNEKIITIHRMLIKDLNFSEKILQDKSRRVLKKILHEYAAFEVITLDSFTHKIIRTFARDLKIPSSFEVAIESDQILEELTESILEKAGVDKDLTKILVAFSLSKTEELRSWDIGKDLYDFSKLLLNENDRLPLISLKEKSLEDFSEQKKRFEVALKTTQKDLILIGKEALEIIKSNGIEKEDFLRKGIIYNHFKKHSDGVYEDIYTNKLSADLLEGKALYAKTLDENKKEIIDRIQPQLTEKYFEAKPKVGKVLILKDLIKYWVPVSLINELEKGLEDFQNSEQRMLLGRFNEIIAKTIANQPVPYIYERLGEKYRHYFIDEFQDTSRLQWQNLIPLIANALESLDDQQKLGSLLLVGDPKQAIYRWRGGDNQQFLNLLDQQSPFQIPSETENLDTNYRSCDSVVTFNNNFFSFVGGEVTDTQQKSMYSEQTQQKLNNKDGGYVEITFIENTRKKEDTIPIYQQQTIRCLQQAQNNHFLWEEMAVLVRKKKQASVIAEILQEHGIPFVSSESLSLSQSKKVTFLIALLRLSIAPDELEQRKEVLEFLWIDKESPMAYHDLLQQYLFGDKNKFFNSINSDFESSFNLDVFRRNSLYDAIEYAIEAFGMSETIDAHLTAFLDNIFEFSLKNESDFVSYLSYWEQKGNAVNISTPEGINAVKILTIHKAKGLEFPVVVIPFAEEDLSTSSNDKMWYPIDEEYENDFEWGRINFSSKLKLLGQSGESFYEEKIRQDHMDSLNTLYVALTRAVSQLYLICPLEKDNIVATKSYSALINHFVKNQGHNPTLENPFCWGEITQGREKEEDKISALLPEFKISTHWQKHLWFQIYAGENEETAQARSRGLLIHDLLGEIVSKEDIVPLVLNAVEKGLFRSEEIEYYNDLLHKVTSHAALEPYFKKGVIVFNEQDILVPNASFVRPDRVVKSSEGWIIIDYKTGKYQPKHEDQLRQYEEILNRFETKVYKKFLVYIDNEIEVKNI